MNRCYDLASRNADTAVTRLLVADHHPVVRRGLIEILHSDTSLQVIGEASTAQEVISQCEASRPDIVVMELRMGGVDAIETIEFLRLRHPLIRIILFTAIDGVQDIYRGLKAGVKGYVLKDAMAQELIDAVRAAAQGRRYLTPRVAAKLADHLDSDQLSDREMEILGLMAAGLPNKGIARKAEITEGTVKFHVNKILSKLDCATRTQAVSFALRRGLIRLN